MHFMGTKLAIMYTDKMLHSAAYIYVMSLVMRKLAFRIYAKTKMQISFALTAKLISAFLFTTRIVQSLYFLNPKFQASSNLVAVQPGLWLYSPVCVRPGWKTGFLATRSYDSSLFALVPHKGLRANMCQVTRKPVFLVSYR